MQQKRFGIDTVAPEKKSSTGALTRSVTESGDFEETQLLPVMTK